MKAKHLLVVLATLGLVACAARTPAAPNPAAAPTMFSAPVPNQVAPGPETQGSTSATPGADVQVILVPSEIVVGPDRFAVGIVDPRKGMVHDASVHFRYFDLSATAPTVESEADAVRLDTPDGATTIFAQERDFNRAGNWGVEVQARYPDGTMISKRIGFQVVDRSPTVKVGARVPVMDTPNLASVSNDLHKLTSAPKPDPAFYRLSLADALKEGKPIVLVFSTPAFCTSRLCGPAYDIESELEKRYGDKINFLSVEVFTGLPNPAATNWQLAPAMKAFGLETEPWLYLIKGDGTVAYRVEGLFTIDEVDRHIRTLIGGKDN